MPQGRLQQQDCRDLHYQLPADGQADDNSPNVFVGHSTLGLLDSMLAPSPAAAALDGNWDRAKSFFLSFWCMKQEHRSANDPQVV